MSHHYELGPQTYPLTADKQLAFITHSMNRYKAAWKTRTEIQEDIISFAKSIGIETGYSPRETCKALMQRRDIIVHENRYVAAQTISPSPSPTH